MCTTPSKQRIFLVVCLSPTFFFGLPLHPNRSPGPFSEVIWGSLEREVLLLGVHLGRQKGLELYSLGSVANKAEACEWRQSLFSVLQLILLVCEAGERRWDGDGVTTYLRESGWLQQKIFPGINRPAAVWLSLNLCCAASEAGLELALHSGHALLTQCYSELGRMLLSDVWACDIMCTMSNTHALRGVEMWRSLNLSIGWWRRPPRTVVSVMLSQEKLKPGECLCEGVREEWFNNTVL